MRCDLENDAAKSEMAKGASKARRLATAYEVDEVESVRKD